MTAPQIVTVYTDYKSPYAYLAKDLAYELEQDHAVRLDWRPYILDIPSFLGSARVDAAGAVLEQDRNAHQWRRVRYSYMDCRRQARKRGLTIRGPQKICGTPARSRGHTVRPTGRRRGLPPLSRHGLRALLAATCPPTSRIPTPSPRSSPEAGADGSPLQKPGPKTCARTSQQSAERLKPMASSGFQRSSWRARSTGVVNIWPTSATG